MKTWKRILLFTVAVIYGILPLTYYLKYHAKIRTHPKQIEDAQYIHRAEIEESDDDYLITHPVYERFSIVRPLTKKQVRLLVIITTAPQREERRSAVRGTWWTQCRSEKDAECIFITDTLDPGHEFYAKLMTEQARYNDIRFQNMFGGFLFGIRFLYHLVYAMMNYDFQYILRADDDYFICFDRLMYELPSPTYPMFHWGFVHQTNRKTVRPDESINIFSKDIVKKFLSQNATSLQCTAIGCQQIALWISRLHIRKFFRHDSRLLHDDMIYKGEIILRERNICEKYIGIHRAIPKYMMLFWNHRYKSNSSYSFSGNLVTNTRVVDTTGRFEWREMDSMSRYVPQLCINKTMWGTNEGGIPQANKTFYKGFLENRLGENFNKWLLKPNRYYFKKYGGIKNYTA